MSGYRVTGGPLDGWTVSDEKFINVPMRNGDVVGRYQYSTLGAIQWASSGKVSNDVEHIRPYTPTTITN